MTFVERQIAHVWGASMIGCSLLFAIEMLLGLPVLALSPVLALFSGMVFLIKARHPFRLVLLPGRGAVPDRGLDGPLAAVRADDLRRRLGGVFLRARPEVPPPSRACGSIDPKPNGTDDFIIVI